MRRYPGLPRPLLGWPSDIECLADWSLAPNRFFASTMAGCEPIQNPGHASSVPCSTLFDGSNRSARPRARGTRRYMIYRPTGTFHFCLTCTQLHHEQYQQYRFGHQRERCKGHRHHVAVDVHDIGCLPGHRLLPMCRTQHQVDHEINPAQPLLLVLSGLLVGHHYTFYNDYFG